MRYDKAMTASKVFVLRIAISVVAGMAALGHMLYPAFIPDAITVGLVLVAFVPWLAPIIKTIELTGVGKLELQNLQIQVDEVKEKEAMLRSEVDALRFLLSGFVTEWELVHLQKLANPEPFAYQRGPGKNDRFVAEIIRLRDLGLISKRIEYSLWDIPLSGDLQQYVALTDRGRTYLALRDQMAPIHATCENARA